MAVFSTLIQADQDALFSILIDYERYPDWTADVTSASVLDREGDIVVAEFVSPELMDGKYVLEFVHGRPNTIVYRQVDLFGKRGLRGQWQLAVVEGKGVRLTGEMDLRSTLWSVRRNAKQAALVLRRRVDLLERKFSGRAPLCWKLVS